MFSYKLNANEMIRPSCVKGEVNKMDRCVVITGAAGGLGHSLVAEHISRGDRIYATDIEMTDKLQELLDSYGQIEFMLGDVTKPEDVKAFTDMVKSRETKIDLLYNVAGIYPFSGRTQIQDTDIEFCKTIFDINALGPLRITQALLDMIQKGSAIINISSEAGSVSAARRIDDYGYCMSKAAVNMWSKLISNAVWPRDARVVCFHPGWMRTRMGGEAAKISPNAVEPEESGERIAKIVDRLDQIPRDWMYMDLYGNLMQW